MSREQRTPSRRQFIHPMSVIQSRASDETEEQARARLAMFQTRPGTIPDDAIQPLSSRPFAGAQPGVSTEDAEPTSSPWKMPQNGYYNTFASPMAPPADALPERSSTPSYWTIPQTEGDAAIWQDWPTGQAQTGPASPLAQAAPSAPPAQNTDPVSGLKPLSTSGLLKKSRRSQKAQTGYVATKDQPWKKQKSRKKRVPVWLVVVSVIVLLVIGLTQGNGTVGATLADVVRAVAGPVAAAEVEAAYLNVQNKMNQVEFQLGLRHTNVPFKLASTAGMNAARPRGATMQPMSLPNMQTFITPALDGEGIWNELEAAPAPYNYLPLDARAFIRPDPANPYAVVSLLQFDTRFSRLHVISGTQEPGGPLGAFGTGAIPDADQAGNALLAAMNGGFKYADGAFGLMADGKVYVPPVQGAATIAITNTGQLIIGAWGVDPQLNSNNPNLVAWRQNGGALLINNGMINPLTQDGAAWGGTILNSQYTWRSGIGITAQGNLIYAGGSSLLPETLGKALHAAGAVMAMETDINPFWVRAFLYERGNDGNLAITKLDPQMQGTGQEYLGGDGGNQRDFFYLTRYTPPANGK